MAARARELLKVSSDGGKAGSIQNPSLRGQREENKSRAQGGRDPARARKPKQPGDAARPTVTGVAACGCGAVLGPNQTSISARSK
jgi:hypothetical protein